MSRWPALMCRKTAAEYVEVHPDTFTKEVAAGRMPSPILFGGRDHWRREEIDKAIQRLGGGLAVPSYKAKFYGTENGKAA